MIPNSVSLLLVAWRLRKVTSLVLARPMIKPCHMLVSKYDGRWSAASSALDLERDNDVSFPSIVVDEQGSPQVASMESLAEMRTVIAACLKGAERNVLGERALDGIGSNI